MTNIENQDTIWKTYPGYPFIQANQFGEIRIKDRYAGGRGGSRRLYKGHILKQYKGHGGYLYVSFGVKGKTVNLRVHRVVATCFIPNPNNLPEVNHKDNNRTNNAVSNLEWCTSKYNNTYKKNFGTSQAEIQGHHIIAVNLETGKVLYFESQSEAARCLGVNLGSVNNVVKGRLNQAGGYWFTEDESEITKGKIQEIKNSMYFLGGVIAVNLETKEVLCFESQSEASLKLGASTGNISDVLSGRRKKTHGYWFCYVNEEAVEKAGAKFGDEVANEVEKLINDEL